MKWKCESCTLLNPKEVQQCIACTAWQPKEPLLVDEDSAVSNRPSPDEEPPVLDLTDGKTSAAPSMMCDQEGAKTDIEGSDVWSCQRCTFQNRIAAARCQVCDTAKKNAVENDENNSKKNHMNGPSNATPSTSILHVSDAVDVPMEEDGHPWQCSGCTYNCNPSWATICDMCNAPKCGASPDSAKNKKHAHDSKPDVPSTSQASPAKRIKSVLKCPKCTLESPTTSNYCKACNYHFTPYDLRKAMEAKRKQAQKSVDEGWTCTKCTLKNQASSKVCDVCESKRNVRLPSEDDIANHSVVCVTDEEDPESTHWVCKIFYRNYYLIFV